MFDEKCKNSLLIVDDDVQNLLYLTRLLDSDYIIYSAKNGASAIERAKKLLPDLILLDIIMPEMSGYEVLATLKATAETKDIPVIFITGLSSSADEEKGLSYDAADYINKPFIPGIIKLRVRNQIKIVNLVRDIKRLSITDQLTGLPNRRSFDEQLRFQWGIAAREHTPVSILVIDVDHFKKYNDTYGHMQGDMALQAVATLLTEALKRSIDFVSRWGGEEFVALLANTTSSGALKVAENIKGGFENYDIPLDDGQVTRITVSIGVNTLVPTLESSIESFIRGADDALYIAKEKGRNRVVEFQN